MTDLTFGDIPAVWVAGGLIVFLFGFESLKEIARIGVRRVFGDKAGKERRGIVYPEACEQCKNGLDQRIVGVEKWTKSVEEKLDDYMKESNASDQVIQRKLGEIGGQMAIIIKGTN